MEPHAKTVIRIPAATNVAYVVIASTLYVILLYLSSHAESMLGVVGYGAVFAVLMIPVYALIHEASHGLLHPDPATNDLGGRWLCALFPISFTFYQHSHFRHHVKNRTDSELWDHYTHPDDRWRTVANLYAFLTGVGYLLIWLSLFLYAFAPRAVYLFRFHPEIASFLEGSDTEKKLRKIRVESLAVLALHAALFWLLDLSVLPVVTLFAMHGFVWSSQNYVNHAFSHRDVLNGAHNLRVPWWLLPVYLNFNLHRAHHQHPTVPWNHLPRFVEPEGKPMSFFYNYLRLWGGPRLTSEPNPRPPPRPAECIPPTFRRTVDCGIGWTSTG